MVIVNADDNGWLWVWKTMTMMMVFLQRKLFTAFEIQSKNSIDQKVWSTSIKDNQRAKYSAFLLMLYFVTQYETTWTRTRTRESDA